MSPKEYLEAEKGTLCFLESFSRPHPWQFTCVAIHHMPARLYLELLIAKDQLSFTTAALHVPGVFCFVLIGVESQTSHLTADVFFVVLYSI